MRTTNIGGKKVELRASPLALLFYRQEFGKDLLDDFKDLQSLEALAKKSSESFRFEDLRLMDFFQLAYALNKAAGKPSEFCPNYEEWLYGIELDLGEMDWIADVVYEAADGFFRSGEPSPK